MALHLLEDWCKGMNVDPRNCLLVMGVPEAFNEGSLESVLRPATGCLSKEDGAFAVLCEFPLNCIRLGLFSQVVSGAVIWL
uniref:Paraneoplastic antigen Ma-like N-terminal domain-containing protein n=1 Tax=Gopherus agassizii TaxID=38772 RepID=A0A452IF00_9SAUR